MRTDELDAEIVEIKIDETLPSSEFRDIDIFERQGSPKSYMQPRVG